MENNVDTCFDAMTPKQYFDNLCSDLIAHIEKSPSPEVATAIARCIVNVAHNLFY